MTSLHRPSLSRRRWLTLAGALAAGGLLSACGFQRRGIAARPLAFARVQLAMNEYSELYAALKRQIEAAGTTQVVRNPQDADARINVLGEGRRKDILSYAGTGKVREFRLIQQFVYQVVDARGRELAPVTTLEVRRDMSFNENEVLAKEQEEQLLFRDMQGDLIQQIMRRLAAIRPLPPADA